MAFKGTLDTPDGITHQNALAVVAQFMLNYTELTAFIALDVYHSQAAYDAGKRPVDRREFSWSDGSDPRFDGVRFSDAFNADAVKAAMKNAAGDLTVFIYALAASRDEELAKWDTVADSKPVKKREKDEPATPPEGKPLKAARSSKATPV